MTRTKSNFQLILNSIIAVVSVLIAAGIFDMRDKLTVLAPAVASNTTINQQQQIIIDANKVKIAELKTTVGIRLP